MTYAGTPGVDRDQFRIIGTEGQIDLSPLSADAPSNVHYPLIENFVSACLGLETLCCPIEESLKTDRVLHLVRREQTPKGVYAEDGGVLGGGGESA